MAQWPVSLPSCSQSLHPLFCLIRQVTRLFTRSFVGQRVRADLPTPHRQGCPVFPEHLRRGPPAPLTVSTSSDAGVCRAGLDPVFSQAAQTTKSAACPQPMWGAIERGSGRGSFQWRPHDPGPELQEKTPLGVGPLQTWAQMCLPRLPELGTGATRTGPQLHWTPGAGSALLHINWPHPTPTFCSLECTATKSLVLCQRWGPKFPRVRFPARPRYKSVGLLAPDCVRACVCLCVHARVCARVPASTRPTSRQGGELRRHSCWRSGR